MFDYTILRSKRKTICITVTNFATVTVKVPFGCSNEKINGFIADKSAWIELQLTKMCEKLSVYEDIFSQNNTLIYGKRIPIIKTTAVKRGKMTDEGIVLPAECDMPRAIVAILKKISTDTLREILAESCQEMRVNFESFTLSNAKGKWGSCDKRARLRFNNKICMLPYELIEYVVIHELCHLFEMNHSTKFWKKVQSFCPDYQIKRRELKNYSFITTLYL